MISLSVLEQHPNFNGYEQWMELDSDELEELEDESRMGTSFFWNQSADRTIFLLSM